MQYPSNKYSSLLPPSNKAPKPTPPQAFSIPALFLLLLFSIPVTTAQTTPPPPPTISKTQTSSSSRSTTKKTPLPLLHLPPSTSSTTSSSSTSKSAASTPIYVLQWSKETDTLMCAREPNKCACRKDALLECAIEGPGILNGCAADGAKGCRCEGVCAGFGCPL
ncbi:hypothetical protein BKA65DRAFT_18170 [Rhexocercosporidium sp. MPI-PUGE-AT-0058]|nr:hypothetical protein BKA65DRAFT_18170 [Rhexocercosporidium sp. MPI-PUGE-AT-0058]